MQSNVYTAPMNNTINKNIKKTSHKMALYPMGVRKGYNCIGRDGGRRPQEVVQGI